ncbi:hypothetical protein D3C80_2128270 [compost metagenome]
MFTGNHLWRNIGWLRLRYPLRVNLGNNLRGKLGRQIFIHGLTPPSFLLPHNTRQGFF